MNKFVKYMATLCLIACTGPVDTQAQCQTPQYLNCLTNFTSFANLFQTPAVYTSDQLNAACSSFNTTSLCVNAAGCSQLSSWTTKVNGLPYLCGAGEAAFLSNQNCFSNYTVVQFTKGCISPGPATAPSNICQSFNALFACVQSNVASLCNEQAALFFATYISTQFASTIITSAPNCTFASLDYQTTSQQTTTSLAALSSTSAILLKSNDGLSTAEIIALAVCLSVGLTAIIIVAILLYYCLRVRPRSGRGALKSSISSSSWSGGPSQGVWTEEGYWVEGGLTGELGETGVVPPLRARNQTLYEKINFKLTQPSKVDHIWQD